MTWLDIDYDPDLWVEIPSQWTISAGDEWYGSDNRTQEEWADEIAEFCWEESSEKKYTASEVELLSQTLLECVRRYPPMYPRSEVLLYLPTPKAVPLPVWIAHVPAEGDRELTLRELTLADDPAAIEPPIVEKWTAEELGEGLRVLRYHALDQHQELVVGLRYAWRSEVNNRDVVLITGSPAPGQVMSAVDAIADLTHVIQLHNDED
ncbi:hypothetical protein [Streptomyces sp. NPDC057794]|uniref:hypothetical protein n=1 Tax=Streptomyces sp. NPDC057794 TaxID=3346251 RepID=UPI003692B511